MSIRLGELEGVPAPADLEVPEAGGGDDDDDAEPAAEPAAEAAAEAAAPASDSDVDSASVHSGEVAVAEPDPEPVPAQRRSTRLAGVQLDQTVFNNTVAAPHGRVGTCTSPPDATTQQIQRHIALVCGSVRPASATPVDQSLESLGWVPPPFFDISKIKDPVLRAKWQQSDANYVFFLAGSAVSYLSKKQPSIAMSSTEAEIYAASLAGLEAVFLISLLEDLVPEAVASPVDIGVDNKGVVDMSQDFVANSRNRHFTRRHLKVRELVEDAYVKISSVKTENNASDILTKPLGKALFEKHRKTLLNM